MFSGGVDSTTAAIELSEAYKKVHLLTYRNGYGHLFLNNSKKRAGELTDKLGDKFNYSLIPIDGIFKKLVLDTLLDDYKEFKSGFIWCLGCKMAMHTQSIIYNLQHHIKVMADGSSQDSDEMVEQMAISVTLIDSFYEKYGIKFFVPVYKQTREEKIKKLLALKFKMGLRINDRFLGIQPRCIPGELYYLPYLLFNKALNHEKPLVIQYFKKKQEIADRYIKEHFQHGQVL
jgi:predicted subunit of tRNA(5-methylaminomethyl-2-thiouridylate) methyltransferase